MSNLFVRPVPQGVAGNQIQETRDTRDLRDYITADPLIQRFLTSGTKQLVVGDCPICKVKLTEWGAMKEHVKRCRRAHQYPVLMRTCYCPYCLKKLSDAYSLSAHIQSTHAVHLIRLAEELKATHGENIIVTDPEEEHPRARVLGMETRKMAEPFPFACSSCRLCWPTAKGLADHFLYVEKQKGVSCGGFLSVYVKPDTHRMEEMSDEIARNRYDFSDTVTCPYCTETYEEAYALSRHIKANHSRRQRKYEGDVTAGVLAKFPSKKYYYAPFFCTQCQSAYKSMDEWAAHIHKNTLNGKPCNGQLRIMKKVLEGGKTFFRGNVHPRQLDSANGEVATVGPGRSDAVPDDPAAAAAAAAPPVVVIKEEPLDEDEMQALAAPNGAAAAADETRVKEEPLDDYEQPQSVNGGSCDPEGATKDDTASVSPSSASPPAPAPPSSKSPTPSTVPPDSTSPSSLPSVPPVVDAQPQKKDDEEAFVCQEEGCGQIFHDQPSFVKHMKAHGYELSNEEEAALIEATADAAPPAAKKSRREEIPSPSSRYPPLTVPTEDPFPRWFNCPECPERSLTAQDHKKHMMDAHSGFLTPGYLCKVCRTRSFADVEEKTKHERMCRLSALSDQRVKVFSQPHMCHYCSVRQPNAYVLLHHIVDHHWDTLKKLRQHHLMASEFLPFRCKTCNVGFEDPRLLLNHFRLREEFGIACFGNLVVHNYANSLRAAEEKQAADSLHEFIPKLVIKEDEADDVDSDLWCPRDPSPSTDIELTGKVKCPYCTEMWPNIQLKLHVKMEHPKIYNEMATFQCKVCKQFGFWNASRYAEHYESCSVTRPGKADERDSVCAPRVMPKDHYPPAYEYNLPAIPEDMGNGMRQCRICAKQFPPAGLLMHQKNDHPVMHFTDAPYHCQRCGDVGFYSHEKYKQHAQVCTGVMPTDLLNDIFAITTLEIEIRTSVRRMEIPHYRVLIDGERRKDGTLTAFNRALKCNLCYKWVTSLPTLAEHFDDAHPKRKMYLYCRGCARIFVGKEGVEEMRRHLMEENAKGNTRCFDAAELSIEGFIKALSSLASDLNSFVRTERTTPLMSQRPLVTAQAVQEANHRSQMQKYGGFKNLARQEAYERRHAPPPPRPAPLLPIRPLNILAKSPLSGERDVFRRQQIAAAARRAGGSAHVPPAHAKYNAYYKEMSAHQRQRDLTRVDFTTPLSLPSEPHRQHNNDGRFLAPIATPTQPRASMLYQPLNRESRPPLSLASSTHGQGSLQGLANRVPSRAPTGIPTMHTSRPVPKTGRMHYATSSFRPMRMLPSSSSAYNLHSGNRIIRQPPPPGSQPRAPVPPPPQLDPMVKKPKVEPKQEPEDY